MGVTRPYVRPLTRVMANEFLNSLGCVDAHAKLTRGGVRQKTWTGYAAIPNLTRCSAGLRKPNELLIRTSLYHRM